jgi:DNA polymerase I-like protein with 3'-5' exonuclease and polymerase domains
MFIELDKSQAEWVVVAYATGDANMIAAIEAGTDVHLHTAHLMFNLPTDLIEHERKLIGHSTDADIIRELRLSDPDLKAYAYTLPRTMSARQCGKKSNHGLNYDEGYRGFAMINEMDEKEAKRVYDLYHRIYPGIKIWYNAVQNDLRKSRCLTNCLGRKVRFMGQWGDDLFKSAYSMIPQSTVVDSLNLGMEQIYEDQWITQSLNVDVLAQVHDSILMQVPIDLMKVKENFDDFYQRICLYTSPELEYNGKKFKIKSDVGIGLNWGESHKVHNPTGMTGISCYADLMKVINGWENLSGERASGLA